MTTLLAATAGGRTMWYLTRGSGVVTLLLLTASMCLGIAGAVRVRTRRLPRFTFAALHRNLTLLAVVFLGVHVATTLADSYTPIGWKDAFVPFLSPYRPLWLGLGALALDLLLALVLTSMLRARVGLHAWRLVHWLAYACWPLALVHSLGTGSDPRAGWLQALAALSVAAVLVAVAARLLRSGGGAGRRLALGGAAVAIALLGGAWYRNGPGAPGWAARAGTPSTLLHSATAHTTALVTQTTRAIPATFNARLSGRLRETRASNGLIDLHVDSTLSGGLAGRLRLVPGGDSARRRRSEHDRERRHASRRVARRSTRDRSSASTGTAFRRNSWTAAATGSTSRSCSMCGRARLSSPERCTGARHDERPTAEPVLDTTPRLLAGLDPHRTLGLQEHFARYGRPVPARDLIAELEAAGLTRPRRRWVSRGREGSRRRLEAGPACRRDQRRRGRAAELQGQASDRPAPAPRDRRRGHARGGDRRP